MNNSPLPRPSSSMVGERYSSGVFSSSEWRFSSGRSERGFTLNKFLVVIATIAIPSALIVPLSGCGSFGSSTPPSFAVSGNVTFDNKPVPEGTIQFKPDVSNGNTGPTASAKIQDGKYEISKSKGLPSGMMIVEISGNEAGGGASLFSDYRTEVELPEENAQQDFDVPAATASGKK